MASVVVAGGGLAGLACAWKLARAGHEVELLERRPAAPAAEELLEGGPAAPAAEAEAAPGCEDAWLHSGDCDLLAAARTLGIPWREAPARGDLLFRDGHLESLPVPTLRGLLAAPGGSPARRLRWARGSLAPARRAGARATDQAAWDGASFEAVVGRALGDDPLVLRLGAVAGLACGEAPARLSHATGLAALAARASGARPVLLEGGLARLRRALVGAITVRRGCEVVEVETESAGARVRYRTQGRLRRVLADAVVLALPPDAVLRCGSKLTPEERGFFEAVELAPERVVRLHLERPPPALAGFRLGFPAADAPLRALVAAHRLPGAVPPGEALLLARLAAEPARRLAAAPDAALVDAVCAALAETPLGLLRPRAVAVERGASPRPLFRPGAVLRIARFERRMERSPRLAFAGRHLLGPGPGAAFTTGLRAATAVARGL